INWVIFALSYITGCLVLRTYPIATSWLENEDFCLRSKPISGMLKPDIAMNSINNFQTRVQVQRLQDEYKLVFQAKEALDLEHIYNNHHHVAEEISDLKAAWTALSGIWAQLGELCET
ncbi:dynein heavy chain 1, cytosolic, partial [Puccinia sorghi]